MLLCTNLSFGPTHRLGVARQCWRFLTYAVIWERNPNSWDDAFLMPLVEQTSAGAFSRTQSERTHHANF